MTKRTLRSAQRRAPLALTPLGLLTLAACGGGGGGGSSTSGSSGGGSASVGGNVVKGPLSNALVFLDYDNDGVLDAGEPSARTAADGSYTLSSSNPNFSIVAVTDGSTIDTASGAVLDGITLKAPSGASVVTPATTLMKEGNLTVEQVAQVLGLPDGVDPTSFNPYAAGVDAADALAVEKASQQIMSVITAFAGALEGAGASEGDAFSAALQTIASTVQAKAAANETLDLTSTSDIALIQTALANEVSNNSDLSAVNTTALNALIGDTASAIKNVNDEIAAITDTDLTSAASKNIFSTVQVLKDQVEAAAAAEVTAPGSGNIAFTDANAVDAAAANSAPSDLVLDSNVISEAAESLVVGVVSTTDSDQPTGVAFTYSIAEVAGTDFDKFTINSATGELSLTEQPDFETKASYSVVVKSVDAGGKALSKTFNVAVTDVNDAPTVANAISDQTIAEDSALSFQFATNVFSDVDAGDSLTYSATLSDGGALPSWLSFDASTRTFSGTPANGDVGAIDVKVTATDGSSATATDTFTITVTNTNDAPTVTSTAVTSVNEDAAYSYTFAASDVDAGDYVTLAATTLPSWLSFNASTGVLSGTPTNAHVGSHAVVLTATDAAGAFDTQSFTITVTNVNDPVSGAVLITGSAIQGQVLTADVSALADADGRGTLSYQWKADGTPISGATASTYTLTQAEVGKIITVAVSYTDGEGTSESVQSSETVAVENVNEAPVGVADTLAATEDTAVTFAAADLLDNDTDADGDTLSIKSVTAITGGTVVLNDNGTVTFTPTANFNGAASFSYIATDGTADSAATTVTVNVGAVNDAPVGSVTISGNLQEAAYLAANTDTVSDQDGLGEFSYQWFSNGAEIVGANSAQYKVTEGDIGSEITVSIRYTDSFGSIENIISAKTTPILDAEVCQLPAFLVLGAETGTNFTYTDATVEISISDSASLMFNYNQYGDAQVQGQSSGVVVNYNGVELVNDAFTQSSEVIDWNILRMSDGQLEIDYVYWDLQYYLGSAGYDKALTFILNESEKFLVDNNAALANTLYPTFTSFGPIPIEIEYPSGADLVQMLPRLNAAPTGIIGIGGILRQGETITADISELEDANGLGPLDYQWKADGINITGATSNTYLLTQNEVGKTITVAVSYTDGDRTEETVQSNGTVAVENVNDAPVGVADTLAATEDMAVIYAAADLLDNDTDADGDTLSIKSVSSITGGTAVLNQNGTVTFTPTANFNGAASFSYIATDGTADSAATTVTVNVGAVNDAPVITSAAVTSINEDAAYSYTFAASDVDAGDSVTLAATTLPSWLSFNASTGVLSGTPTNAHVGSHAVVLTATDAAGAFDTQSFTITVTDTANMSIAVTFPLTGNNFVDASTQGSKWSTSNGPLTYAVANGFNGETWNYIDLVNSSLSLAMSQLETFTNLQVQNLGNFVDATAAADAGATIVLSLDGSIISSNLGNTVWAVGFYPNSPDDLYEHVAGDMYLNLNSAGATLPTEAYNPGGQGFMLLLHELGHAVGLKHPFDNTGGRMTYEEAGYSAYQDQTYTLMAYEDEFGGVLNAPATFMLGDVLALMSLYGVNQSTNAGDTTYSFHDNTARKTIWDASGSDVLNLTAVTDPVTVYLSYLYSDADLGMEYGHIIQNPNSNLQKWHHLLGEFEDVYTGAGNDTIYGDENANILSAGDGNDFIAGYEADDLLYGGSGSDFFMLAEGHGNDIIKDFELGIDTCLFWDGSSYDASIASLNSTSNGEAIYTLSDGSSLLLEGILFSDISVLA